MQIWSSRFCISHLSTLRNLVVNVHCQGSRVKDVEALEAAIRSAASMLPNHPAPALHRFLESELVKEWHSNGEAEPWVGQEAANKPCLVLPSVLRYGLQSNEYWTLFPVLMQHGLPYTLDLVFMYCFYHVKNAHCLKHLREGTAAARR
jgi:hypothetical protein